MNKEVQLKESFEKELKNKKMIIETIMKEKTLLEAKNISLKEEIIRY